MEIMKQWITTLMDISFWISFVEKFKDLGPLAPVFLAFIESVVPALPLIVIISFNVTAYGPFLGFIYSWMGTFLGSALMFTLYRYLVKPIADRYLSKRPKIAKTLTWISTQNPSILFILTMLPFTPSSLINLVYGLTDFSQKKFYLIIGLSKSAMVLFMTFFGHSMTKISENPLYVVIAVGILIIAYFISKKVSKKFLGE